MTRVPCSGDMEHTRFTGCGNGLTDLVDLEGVLIRIKEIIDNNVCSRDLLIRIAGSQSAHDGRQLSRDTAHPRRGQHYPGARRHVVDQLQ